MGSGTRRVGAVLASSVVLVVVAPARGAVWSVQPTPFGSSGGSVAAVSCVSAKVCTAVGALGVGVGTGAMGWNGVRWRMEATPVPDPAHETYSGADSLAGVSCTSTSACVAVGEYAQMFDYDPVAMKVFPVEMPLAERWNGVSWSVLPFPSVPVGATEAGLNVVSCTSSSACLAVGRSNGLLAERWDGSSWSLESMPEPVPLSTTAGGTGINGLSCSSSNSCMAVGDYSPSSGSGTQSFAERWDGSGWSLAPLAHVAGVSNLDLSGVSCASASACTAVGQYDPDWPMPVWTTVAERWNGTSWSLQRTFNGPSGFNELLGVSCTSSRACLAVGYSWLNPGYRALVERWDGTRWSIERTPGAGGAGLQAVSCTSSMVCTAIGGGPSGTVALQSAPAGAKLSGVPAGCTGTRSVVKVTGAGIASVDWALDGKTIKGRAVRRGMRYVASIRLSPGRHTLTIKVKFTTSSQAHAVTLRRAVFGCPSHH